MVKPSNDTCKKYLMVNKKCIPEKEFNEMKSKLNSALCGGALCTPSTVKHENNQISPLDYKSEKDGKVVYDGKYVELIDGNVYVTYVFTDQSYSLNYDDKSAQVFQLMKNSSGGLETRFRPSYTGMWSNWIAVQ